MDGATESRGKKQICLGLIAHVDAGKTTLSEAMLYLSGKIKKLGRVDHRDSYLDTHRLERERGITIFSKQAVMPLMNSRVYLLDTPGHADFSAEAERTVQILDYAVLVISGTDGVQAHTETLWRLLERYHVPCFLFVTKMDLPGADEESLMEGLRRELSEGCVDFTNRGGDFFEKLALCDEAAMEKYLDAGLSEEDIPALIRRRSLFPCFFGSGLKTEGVEELLDAIDRYCLPVEDSGELSARVFKIARDAQGSRMTWLKIGGGELKVRTPLRYTAQSGEELEEKINQIRLYSGSKYETADAVQAGQVCAVLGLSATWPGQGLGAADRAAEPVLEPVLSYRMILPAGTDPAALLPKLMQLQEEDPQLHISWNERTRDISVQLMGRVQTEILKRLIQERFDLDVSFDAGRIMYRETIGNTVEGVGHFEPLRHDAEVHLLLEPLPRGSGLVFDTKCPLDVLDGNYQRLILTHLEEKVHRGVLTGGPITDLKITLLVGKAHLKHTEGGDFRQATYRAVRQGLMQAKSVLLEPWYAFTLLCPTEQIGRAITDIRAMGGELDAPEGTGEMSTLHGLVPAAEVRDYAETLAAYTRGRGQLQLTLHGYAPCHNAQQVVEALGYDPEGDLDNTPDSVFCAHGAGFNVRWNEVKNYMHLESGLTEEKSPQILTRNLRLDDKELEKIMERQFGPQKTTLYRVKAETRPATEEIVIKAPKQKYIIVDGYNVIFAWEHLAAQAKTDLDAARRQLCDALSSFAGYTKCRLVVVFDGYKQKGNPGEKTQFHNIQVVYTREGETADAYIEALADEIGSNYSVRVASSDSLVQLGAFRSGVLRMSARELMQEVSQAKADMKAHFHK